MRPARALSPPLPAGLATPASVKVGLGQLEVSANPSDVLCALGLGSCIGLVMADPVAGVAGMAHVMLPEATLPSARRPKGKYADSAVPALLAAVVLLGAEPERLVVKMAGGAQIFVGSGGRGLDVGPRNAEAVRAALRRARLRLLAEDVGGNRGRTLEVEVATGVTTVRTVGGAPVVL